MASTKESSYSLDGQEITIEEIEKLPQSKKVNVVEHTPGGDIRPWRFVEDASEVTSSGGRLTL